MQKHPNLLLASWRDDNWIFWIFVTLE